MYEKRKKKLKCLGKMQLKSINMYYHEVNRF